MIEFKAAFGERVTVTSALPYVNGVKHLGNIVGSILPADIFHRFLDLFNIPNIFICGTDEHGTAVELAAIEDMLKPEEYAEKYYIIQRDIYKKWNFDFTYFGRTSSRSNHEITKDLFLAINNNGYIIEQKLLLPYCKGCGKFLPDRFIHGICPKCSYDSARGDQCENCGALLDPQELVNPECSICSSKDIEFREEVHLFLDFPKLQPSLEEWLLGNKHWPDNTRNFALGWIKEGLKPRCVTRNLTWGINVPLAGFEKLVFYVWFDAPIGYIAITKDGVKDWEKWWTDSRIYHFLGKDNIPFHTIFWPGMLIASGKYSLPYYVAGYEYLNWGGRKFSTSKGNGLFSDEVLELFPTDYWRFYLSSILPENKDSNFDWDDFASRINNELIANYGNLFYRVTYFLEKNFSGEVPEHGAFGKDEWAAEKFLNQTINYVEKYVTEVRLKDALKAILALADEANRYFQSKKPWETINTNREACATTLYFTVNMLRTISTLLYPFIPATGEKALRALNVERTDWSYISDFILKPGHGVKALILFKKIEEEELNRARQYKTRYLKRDITESVKEKIEVRDGMIPFSEFSKIDLRVGTITEVMDHPSAEKLYIMQVDLGSEKRQIVAGLKGIYNKPELEGSQVIVVCNLEPKELRGVKSHGMLLASEDGTILMPEKKVKNGSKVM